MLLSGESMRNLRRITLAAAAAAALSACAPTHNVRGNLLEDYQLAEVTPGRDSQTDVLRKLGSPTTKAPFDDNIWYYLGQEMEKKGILDPSVLKERIIVVTFDQGGIVSDIHQENGGRVDLPYVQRKTPTSGNEMTALQQILGNLGKFNKEEEP